ncbi:MAG: YicC/YloC family endoribonuclease [Ruminococcus sp.]|nr:YicC/YloC family endoribonuclease [Ruminococcus sp.]
MRSMTGYGKSQSIIDDLEISVEIRSVNHRYYEFSSRIPRNYAYLEEKLKNLLHEKIFRGKVEISVSINNIEDSDCSVEINKPVLESYFNALAELSVNGISVDEKLSDIYGKTYRIANDLTLSKIMKIPDIFTVARKPDDEEKIWSAVKSVAENALKSFISMREAEGERLKSDIAIKLSVISGMVGKIEVLEPQSVELYRERLYNKLREVLENSNIDEQRIITECAVFSDKVAVDEETVRLKSHINQVLSLINSDEPSGKKIDFIIQEMNREVNTIGSKSQSIDITRIVVDLKSEIEKIREQIQNVE